MEMFNRGTRPVVILISLLLLTSCLAKIPTGQEPEGGYYKNEPRVYNKNYDKVWDATVKAAEELNWKIDWKDKPTGKIKFATSYVYNAYYKDTHRAYSEPSIDELDYSRTMDYLKKISYFEKATPEEAPPHPMYIKENLNIDVDKVKSEKTKVKANYKIVPFFDYKIGHLGTVSSRGRLEEALYTRIDELLNEEEITPPVPPRSSQGLEEIYQLSDIFFDFDKSNIRVDAIPVLLDNIETIKNNPELTIVIYGYADIRGTDDYNLRLARRRADATKMFLIRHGINHRRIIAVSKGETLRFATGTTESEYQLNRRSHFIPVKVEEKSE